MIVEQAAIPRLVITLPPLFPAERPVQVRFPLRYREMRSGAAMVRGAGNARRCRGIFGAGCPRRDTCSCAPPHRPAATPIRVTNNMAIVELQLSELKFVSLA